MAEYRVEVTPPIVVALDRLMSGHGSSSDLNGLKYLAEVVNSAGLCGSGRTAGKSDQQRAARLR